MTTEAVTTLQATAQLIISDQYFVIENKTKIFTIILVLEYDTSYICYGGYKTHTNNSCHVGDLKYRCNLLGHAHAVREKSCGFMLSTLLCSS